MFESLVSLPDQQLLANTDSIVVQDRKLTLKLLVHLHEIDRRKLYLKQGYASMFDYCTRRLRFSEPAAARRIRTARCLARFPRLHDLLESGDVNLTTASMVAKLLKPANADVIIGRIKGKSRREVELIVAELQPASMLLPDRVRTIIVPIAKVEENAPVTVAGDSEKSPRVETSAETPLALEGTEILATAETQPSTPTYDRRKRVEFTTREQVISKLDRVRSLASHRLPVNAPFEQLIEFMADYFLKREDPQLRQQRREGREDTTVKHEAPAHPRQIPAAVRDQVFVRDQRCTFVGPDGKRCDSTHVLQVDHIQPVARRGAASISNLRLLCAYHNRMESERLMGKRRVIRESSARYAT